MIDATEDAQVLFLVGFMVYKVALGQEFLSILWFLPVSVIPPVLYILICVSPTLL
jgi:hypothetical protein